MASILGAKTLFVLGKDVLDLLRGLDAFVCAQTWLSRLCNLETLVLGVQLDHALLSLHG